MEIQGQGFKLRGWKADDAVSLQKNADNFNVSSFLIDSFPHPYTMEDAESWVANMLNLNPNYNFVIDIGGEAAGSVGIHFREDIYRKTALIGYWLGENYWGKGIMPQAVQFMVNYTFENLDILRLQAGILSNNPRSMRVLEKAGFVKEGVLKKSIIKNGVVLDEHVYGIVKE
jgi:RimJ/RimL family protein N-acetyltransferase